ncbi:CorA metal ion transporter [Coemansia sp. Benny D115]|nr:CorA metal ion transporter [Coemansia sp. Benny D115]
MGKSGRSSGKRKGPKSSGRRHQQNMAMHDASIEHDYNSALESSAVHESRDRLTSMDNGKDGGDRHSESHSASYRDSSARAASTGSGRPTGRLMSPPPINNSAGGRYHALSTGRLSDHVVPRGYSEGLDNESCQQQPHQGGGGAHSSSIVDQNLANVISHYMHGLDSDSTTDMLASRYYGNMAHITDSDWLPRPMNSTLPLFSPSVVNTGRRLRAKSSYGSEESMARHRGSLLNQSEQNSLQNTTDTTRQNEPCSSTTDNTQPETEPPIAIASTAAADHSPQRRESTTSNVPAEEPDEKVYGLGVQHPGDSRPASQARARRSQNMGTTQYTPAAATKKTAVARGAPGLSYMFSPTIASSRPSSIVGMTTPPQPPKPLPQQQQQPVVPGDNQPVSFTTAAAAGTNAAKALVAGPVQDSQSSGHSSQSVGHGSSGAAARATKAFGAINIAALEQFLDEGEIPESTSEEEEEDSSNYEISWSGDDYSRPHSRTSVPYSDQSTFSSSNNKKISSNKELAQQQVPMDPSPPRVPVQERAVSQRSSGSLGYVRASPALSNYRFSPRVRGTDRSSSSVPDERAPLLDHVSISMPPQYGSDVVAVGAAAETAGCMANANSRISSHVSQPPPVATAPNSHSPVARSAHSANYRLGQKKKSHGSRHRGRKKHHEELFLDKDGFIDESYRFTFFNPAVGTIRAQEFADLRTPNMDLADLLQVGGCFWIDVLRPSFQEMHLFSKIFGIHALTVEDIMTQDMREKCETHANYYFVCFRSFDNDPNSETYLEPKCIYNIVLREGIITFHMDSSVHQYHVLRRIRRQIDHIVVTPDWLNYAIIDDITDLLAPILQNIEFDVDQVDELVLVISSSEQSDMLLRISMARKRIMMALRLMQGKADVVRALIKRFESATAMSTNQINVMSGTTATATADRMNGMAGVDMPSRRVSSSGACGDPAAATTMAGDAAFELALDQRKGHETLLYLGDVLDHIVTMMQNAAHYDNILGRAHANYLAQISIELTESSNRTNDVVAKLSALAAIVVPLNFITGMWGANVKVPGQDYDDLHYFFYILGLCMLYVVIAIAWARRYKIF